MDEQIAEPTYYWTDSQIAELKQRIDKGLTVPKIAWYMRRSERAITQKCYELDFKWPKAWTDARVEKLRQLTSEKLSASQIGRELGITRNAVIGKCHREDIPLISGFVSGNGIRKARHPRKTLPVFVPVFVAEEIIESPILPNPPQNSPCGITIFELESYHCRWPLANKNYCGAFPKDGFPYCGGHCRIAYVRRHRAEPRFKRDKWVFK